MTITRRAFAEQEIKSYCESRDIVLTEQELRNAVAGVEYWLSETIGDSVSVAVDVAKEEDGGLNNGARILDIQEEMKSRVNLINHILSGNFFGEEFCRYSIEVSKGDKLITTRLGRIGNEFSISFILQEDKDGSWEDIEDIGFIKFVKGSMNNINDVITDEVFNSIIPTMIAKLSEV